MPPLGGLEQLWLDTDQGAIEVWILPGRGVSPAAPGPAVMLAHGNREIIDRYLGRASQYRKLGVTVVLGEYRGYGRSAGEPTQERITADYARIYDLVASRPDVDPRRIALHGRSLGGGVVCSLSRHRRPAAMILESTFSSVQDMASGAPRAFLADTYDNAAAVAAYDGPVLILHGTRDDVVPVSHARRLKERAQSARLILYEFGHSDGPPSWKIYWRDIRSFLVDSRILRR